MDETVEYQHASQLDKSSAKSCCANGSELLPGEIAYKTLLRQQQGASCWLTGVTLSVAIYLK